MRVVSHVAASNYLFEVVYLMYFQGYGKPGIEAPTRGSASLGTVLPSLPGLCERPLLKGAPFHHGRGGETQGVDSRTALPRLDVLAAASQNPLISILHQRNKADSRQRAKIEIFNLTNYLIFQSRPFIPMVLPLFFGCFDTVEICWSCKNG